MNSFRDKVIWITGASSGIGEALALELARRGARLVISSRRREELERVAALTQLPDLDLLVLPFDLADTSNATAWAAQVMNKFGRIDVLVNNGGYSQRSQAMATPLEIDRQLMEVNYFAHVALSKAVLPYLKRQRSGQIVVISSIAGKFGFFLRSSYSAAKHALHGFFDSLRLETEKDGIRVLLVCPGKIRTNVSLNAVTANGESHRQMDPSHRDAMSPEKCAFLIVKAMASGKEEVYIGGKELLMVHLKRLFPRLFSFLIRKQSPL